MAIVSVIKCNRAKIINENWKNGIDFQTINLKDTDMSVKNGHNMAFNKH